MDLIHKEAGVLCMLNTIFMTCHVTIHKKTIFPTKVLEKKNKMGFFPFFSKFSIRVLLLLIEFKFGYFDF